MGMGGHLMWTGVARNIKKNLGEYCNPVEGGTLCKSEIFKNNPLLHKEGAKKLNLSNPKCVYLKDQGEKVKFKTKNHIIEFICNELDIYEDIELKCEIYLSESEKNRAQNIIKFFPKEYVCIEPHSKTSWMQSRIYPFKKYQNIVNALKDKFNFVQIGSPKSKKIDNVIYTNGDLTFRETYEVLRQSMFFLSTEGGLVHLANASGTKSFVIYTSYQHPSMTMYPKNILIDIALYRDEILGFKNHDLYKKERDSHDENEIIEAILEHHA